MVDEFESLNFGVNESKGHRICNYLLLALSANPHIS